MVNTFRSFPGFVKDSLVNPLFIANYKKWCFAGGAWKAQSDRGWRPHLRKAQSDRGRSPHLLACAGVWEGVLVSVCTLVLDA